MEEVTEQVTTPITGVTDRVGTGNLSHRMNPLPSSGGVPKRARDPDEVEALARRLGADWRPGDRVMTWLNRHEGRAGELSLLVEDGWSWADIGRAMHLAGIHYRTGQPISGDVLRVKAYQARQHARVRAARARTSVPGVSSGLAQSGSGSVDIVPNEESEFRPARLAGWSGQPWREQDAQPAQDDTRPDPAPAGRADAVINRLMKKRSPTT